MNTIGSVYYGWAFLILCGGGSYYFAKRSINAERYERQAAANELRARQNRQFAASHHHDVPPPPQPGVIAGMVDKGEEKLGKTMAAVKAAAKGDGGHSHHDQSAAFNPSSEASADPAPTDRAPGERSGAVHEESKFESSRPFRSRKGDRFS